MKLSSLIFTACLAAEKELPAASRGLIDEYDRLQGEWRNAGWPSPTPADLRAAGEAVDADPFARFAMELRRQGNIASQNEWEAGRAAKEAA